MTTTPFVCHCGTPDARRRLGFEIPLCDDCWRIRNGRGLGLVPKDAAGQIRENVLGVDESGKIPSGGASWEWRPPVPKPDIHHDMPVAINGVIAYQQAPTVHCRGARESDAGRAKSLATAERLDTKAIREEMTDRQRAAWRLRDLHGFTAREIAEIMETTEDAVESLIRGAKRRLAKSGAA